MTSGAGELAGDARAVSVDVQLLLAETAREIFASGVSAEAQSAGWSPTLWRTLEELGMTRLGVPEAAGGAGGELADAALLVRIAAGFAAPVPLAETALLAGWLLAETGLPLPNGPLTAAVVRGDQATDVPYARVVSGIAVLVEADHGWSAGLALPAGFTVGPGANLADEPRDHVTFHAYVERQAAPSSVTPETLAERGALARSIQLAGAIERVLELSVAHASVRHQFGVPLSRFQAVQHLLATMAGEAAAANEAAAAAIESPTSRRISAAKVRTSEAAGVVAAMAHQVHGAIGFTEEHRLHHLTRRLWAWRDEFGSDSRHAVALGSALLAGGAAQLWDWISSS